jgi:hypothetical protein
MLTPRTTPTPTRVTPPHTIISRPVHTVPAAMRPAIGALAIDCQVGVGGAVVKGGDDGVTEGEDELVHAESVKRPVAKAIHARLISRP